VAWTKPGLRICTTGAWGQPPASIADPAKRNDAANGGTPVVTTIKTHLEEVKDADHPDVGRFFLAVLDETEPLLGCWKGRQNAHVRGVTLLALPSWLSRGSQHARELAHTAARSPQTEAVLGPTRPFFFHKVRGLASIC
jgi:hypothetical protein